VTSTQEERTHASGHESVSLSGYLTDSWILAKNNPASPPNFGKPRTITLFNVWKMVRVYFYLVPIASKQSGNNSGAEIAV